MENFRTTNIYINSTFFKARRIAAPSCVHVICRTPAVGSRRDCLRAARFRLVRVVERDGARASHVARFAILPLASIPFLPTLCTRRPLRQLPFSLLLLSLFLPNRSLPTLPVPSPTFPSVDSLRVTTPLPSAAASSSPDQPPSIPSPLRNSIPFSLALLTYALPLPPPLRSATAPPSPTPRSAPPDLPSRSLLLLLLSLHHRPILLWPQPEPQVPPPLPLLTLPLHLRPHVEPQGRYAACAWRIHHGHRVLGGGQFGKMLCQAVSQMGVKMAILDREDVVRSFDARGHGSGVPEEVLGFDIGN